MDKGYWVGPTRPDGGVTRGISKRRGRRSIVSKYWEDFFTKVMQREWEECARLSSLNARSMLAWTLCTAHYIIPKFCRISATEAYFRGTGHLCLHVLVNVTEYDSAEPGFV
jgi:hypothetical protein